MEAIIAKPKLFRRDFTMMTLGQIASLFGNSILRFALSLYVLDVTGSAATFGGILAVSMLPMIICSPLGGVLADRVSRRNIMVILDFATSALIIAFMLLLNVQNALALIAVMMILLSAIQAFYQPSVQSSIPLIVDETLLAQANGVVTQVQALASLLGPIAGGFLYGLFGITPILYAGAACFFLSAVMELFLHIPFTKPEQGGSAIKVISGDLRGAFHFLAKENVEMFKMLFLAAAINMFYSSMYMVGMPYIIKVYLGLSSELYGFAEAGYAVGSILGGMLSGVAAKRYGVKKMYKLLLYSCIASVFMIIGTVTNVIPLGSYALIMLSIVACMCFAAMFNVLAMTYMQTHTPPQLLGKVFSFVSMISCCAFPIGQAMYGLLFDALPSAVYLVVMFAVAASIAVAFITKKTLRNVPE